VGLFAIHHYRAEKSGQPTLQGDSTVHSLTASERRILGNSLLFADVEPKLIDAVLAQCRVRELQPQDTLLSPEQINHFIYVVLSGRFEVHIGENNQLPLASISAGECVGEMSVLDSQKPSARVIAVVPSRVVELHQSMIWQFVDATEGMARNLLYILSSRLRVNTEALFESLRRQLQFERYADLDGLTGLHNRRWLDRTLEQFIIAASEPDSPPAAIILLDIDHFKQFNDQHGHPAGDVALRQVADTVSQSLRPDDNAARYGGEEFAVLLADANRDQGIQIAERLCTAVRDTQLQDGDGKALPSVTISLGIAQYRHGQSVLQWLETADSALYRAKDTGRDQVAAN